MAVTNYLYEYADGTRGNSPFQRDASGSVITNAAGGVSEGKFLGRQMEDGSINQSPIGNVTAQGNVNLYGGYSVPAEVYYATPNGTPGTLGTAIGTAATGPRPSNGYGIDDSPGAGGLLGSSGGTTGGAVSGSTAPSAPVAGGGSSPSTGGAVFGPSTPGAVGGNTGSSGGSSTSANTSTSTGNAATTRPVDAPTETIEGRVQNLLATDAKGNYTNALVQQARENAEEQFAGRGLLNSSVSQEAAMQAAISKAIEIAGPDAQTYFSQGRANQDTLNTFKRDEIANNNDMAKLDKQLALEREKLTVQGSQFNQELAYKYDSLKLGQDSKIEAEQRAHQYALEIKNIDAVNAAYDLYLRRIQDIDMNKDLTAENKQQMKNAAGKDFDLYAKAKGISWQMGLGDRFGSAGENTALQQVVEGGILNSGRGDAGS